MHKIFLSYHHANDQKYKNALINTYKDIVFIDKSVDNNDIDDTLSDERIREKIRDEYLQNTTVTILLVGTETAKRKHIDWELYSSMYNGAVNKQSGILVINLPSITGSIQIPHGDKEKIYYPNNVIWFSCSSRKEYEQAHPYLPERIIDNIINKEAKISVTNWESLINDPTLLKKLIELTFKNRQKNKYDLSTPMRKNNSSIYPKLYSNNNQNIPFHFD